MTKRLIKTRKDHRQARALLGTGEVEVTMSPEAGALPAGVVDTAHAGVTFALAGAVGAPHFAVTAGALPPGMSLVGNSLSGTPTEVGANSFSIQGTDDFGNSVTNEYTLAVTAE